MVFPTKFVPRIGGHRKGHTKKDDNKHVLRGQYKVSRPVPPFRGDEVIVARHSETIAEVFPDWIQRAKLDEASYHPFDLNMPVRVPRRKNLKDAYQSDPPISEVGRIMAQIFARELVTRNAVPKSIYTPPTLACVQTAADIRSFIGSECDGVYVEPALAYDQGASENWLSLKEFNQLKYNINEDYTPEQKSRSLYKSDGVKKLLSKLAEKKKGIVLVILEAQGLKVLADLEGNRGDAIKELSPSMFPPMSSMIFSPNSEKGSALETSENQLRPLTTIGECSRMELDMNTDAA
nr:Phosphoglycerate mutase domain containing protein [Haemonchus contortus]